MGVVFNGAMTLETAASLSALCLRGQMRFDSQGRFIRMALDLPA